MVKSHAHWDKIRSQFDALPYPDRPLDMHPCKDLGYLAQHNYTIPYYLRNHRVIDSKDKWILDAGCGSGFKLLALAVANPEANLVGIDISPKSLAMAQQRLEYQEIRNPFEFHCLPVEELPHLPYKFDYINCDDVLYLLEDPVVGLQAMKSALKPDGILRVNMHSALQRANYYQVQAFLSNLGCLEGTPTPEEIEVTRQTMAVLEDWVLVKSRTWTRDLAENDQSILMNYLFRGDTGITMAEFSAMLQQADLEFISMVNWRQWDLEKLFVSIEELPIAVALSLADMSPEERIHIFELLHPIHRLLDLYCGHPGQASPRSPLADWTDTQWQHALIHFHPQLQTPQFKAILAMGATKLGMLALHKHLSLDSQPFLLDWNLANCFHPLLEQPLPIANLCDRWRQINPVDPITLEPATPEQAFEIMRNTVIQLEAAGYLMVEWAEA